MARGFIHQLRLHFLFLTMPLTSIPFALYNCGTIIRYGANLGVAHFVTPLKCTYNKYDWQVTSQKPHKKHKSPNKHHHHGGGAAHPSSGMDLINPCRLRGGRPCASSFQPSSSVPQQAPRTDIETNMRKAAHPSGGMGSSNQRRSLYVDKYERITLR